MPQINVYLAGPDVFYPDAIQRGEEKKRILSLHNLTGHYPLDNELQPHSDLYAFGLAIGAANESMMSSCQVIMANMDPWHGPGTDNGTAFEMGFMSALAKNNPNILIVGYYSNGIPDNFAKRVTKMVYADNVSRDASNGRLIGKDGLTIEEFEMQDNLMLINAIHKTGGMIFESFDAAAKNINTLLARKIKTKQPAPIAPRTTGFMPMFDNTSKTALLAFGAVLTTAVALNYCRNRPG